MSFATRLKKLTDVLYSPTKPSSEAAIRAQFDDSIQEAYTNVTSILTSTVQGASGAYNTGINAVGVAATNVESAVAEVQNNISTAAAALIVNGSVTDAKMSPTGLIAKTNLMTITGSADLDDIAINKAATEANATAIDILEDHHLYYTTTGTATAFAVTRTELFDFTKNGSLRINPHLTNTASSTIAVNGTTKGIRKYDITTGAYVVLAAEDIKKNNQLELRFDVANDFFVLAPRGGGLSIFSDSGYLGNVVYYAPYTYSIETASINALTVTVNLNGTLSISMQAVVSSAGSWSITKNGSVIHSDSINTTSFTTFYKEGITVLKGDILVVTFAVPAYLVTGSIRNIKIHSLGTAPILQN